MTVAGLCYLQDDDNSFYVFSYQYFVRALEPSTRRVLRAGVCIDTNARLRDL